MWLDGSTPVDPVRFAGDHYCYVLLLRGRVVPNSIGIDFVYCTWSGYFNGIMSL